MQLFSSAAKVDKASAAEVDKASAAEVDEASTSTSLYITILSWLAIALIVTEFIDAGMCNIV